MQKFLLEFNCSLPIFPLFSSYLDNLRILLPELLLVACCTVTIIATLSFSLSIMNSLAVIAPYWHYPRHSFFLFDILFCEFLAGVLSTITVIITMTFLLWRWTGFVQTRRHSFNGNKLQSEPKATTHTSKRRSNNRLTTFVEANTKSLGPCIQTFWPQK